MTSYEHKVKNIYLGDPGWRPGPNTYAYYPLTENANDVSGNNRDITTSGASSYGSDGAVLPNSNHSGLLIPFNIDYSGTWTISFYVKGQALSGHGDSRIVDLYYTNNRIDCRIEDLDLDSSHHPGNYSVLKNNGYSSPVYTIGYTSNTWIYVCLTIDNGTVKAYKDGTLGGTTTVTGTTTYFRLGQEYNKGADRHLYGNIKDVIIDEKTRTDQEVADYFDQTKTDYGIS